MSKSDEAIREFAEKWGIHFEPEEPGFYKLKNDTKECLVDITALINEYFVPKERHDIIIATADKLLLELKDAYPKAFVEWIGFNSATLYYRDVDEKWIKTRFEMSENPSEEYDEYTTDELFNYWKENKQ